MLLNIYQYKKEYSGVIPVVWNAAGVVSNQPGLRKTFTLSAFTPASWGFYSALYGQGSGRLPTYNDGLMWNYRKVASDFLLTGEGSDSFACHALANCAGQAAAMELYFDDKPYPYGMYFFDISTPPSFQPGTGKLEAYVSKDKRIFGGRGIQINAIQTALLPVLKRHPELWEKFYREKHAAEPLVRIVDTPPTTDGKRDAMYDQSKPIRAGDVKIDLLSDPKNLHVFVEASSPEVSLRLEPADKVESPHAAVLTFRKDGTCTAKNEQGQELLQASASAAGAPWKTEMRIPYSAIPGQASWLNGVENGRYQVTLNGAAPQAIYMLSAPDRILRRMEAISLGTIDTWHKVWQELGVIPSGYRSPNARVKGWEMSDAGNYAHLIKTIAYWLIYQDGKSEWELIKKQTPAAPLPADPLPASVLKAQQLAK